MTSTAIANECNTRFTNLRNAYNNLVVEPLVIKFEFKNANGEDVSWNLGNGIKYASTLDGYKNMISTNAQPANYTQGNYTYTWTGEWSPALDLTESIRLDRTYTAVYDAQLNLADFTQYNAAKTDLMSTLVDEAFSADSLTAAAALLADMQYSDYTEAQQQEVLADNQATVDSETQKLVDAKAALQAVSYDTSVAEALKQELAAASRNDPDMYSGNISFTYTQTVSVASEDVVGLIYAD